MIRVALFAALLLAIAGAAPAAASKSGACLSLQSVTAFAPRNEIYVVVKARCEDAHFADEDPILAYLEVLVGDLPAVGRDVRVYAAEPDLSQTYVFSDLAIDRGDLVLVRLTRFGTIFDLKSVKVN